MTGKPEYFGDLSMEWRTVIEQFMALPVTVRTTKTSRCYQIHANDRHPERMQQLANAIAEINARNIIQGNRRLSCELLEYAYVSISKDPGSRHRRGS
jgi:capsular polysaccharide biosynthesis protein